MNRIKENLRRFGGFVLAAMLASGVLMALPTATAQGQRRVIIVRRPIYRRYYNPWWGRPFGYDPYQSRYSQYIFRNSDSAYQQGFHDGLKTGQGDIKNQRTFDPERSHYFQEAGFGNFGEVYRNGFQRGYADGYRS